VKFNKSEYIYINMSCEEACMFLFVKYKYMISVEPNFEVIFESKQNPYETCKPFLKILLLKFHPDKRLQWDERLMTNQIIFEELEKIVRLDSGEIIEKLNYVKDNECFNKFIEIFSKANEPIQESEQRFETPIFERTQAPKSPDKQTNLSGKMPLHPKRSMRTDYPKWSNEEEKPEPTPIRQNYSKPLKEMKSEQIAPEIVRIGAATTWNPQHGWMVIDKEEQQELRRLRDEYQAYQDYLYREGRFTTWAEKNKSGKKETKLQSTVELQETETEMEKERREWLEQQQRRTAEKEKIGVRGIPSWMLGPGKKGGLKSTRRNKRNKRNIKSRRTKNKRRVRRTKSKSKSKINKRH